MGGKKDEKTVYAFAPVQLDVREAYLRGGPSAAVTYACETCGALVSMQGRWVDLHIEWHNTLVREKPVTGNPNCPRDIVGCPLPAGHAHFSRTDEEIRNAVDE